MQAILSASWWVCVVSLGLVTLTYLGYPAAVALLSVLAGREPKRRADWRPAVTVIIVARNEAERIAARLSDVLAGDYPADRLDIVLVDDASEDETSSQAALAGGDRLRLVYMEQHLGKAAALNAAVERSGGEVLVFTDARQRFAPDAIRRLVGTLADEKVRVVSGLLELAGGGGMGAYWRLERFTRYHEGRLLSTFGATGAIYAIRRTDFRRLDEDTILDDVVVPLMAISGGGRVVLDRRAIAYDEPAEPGREWTRKVRTLAGSFQLLMQPRRMGNPFQPRLLLQFLFHKAARLLVPLELALLLVSSAIAEGLFALFLLQALFYLLALVGGLAALGGRKLGLLGWPFTFVLLNGAVLAGFWRYLRGRASADWRP